MILDTPNDTQFLRANWYGTALGPAKRGSPLTFALSKVPQMDWIAGQEYMIYSLPPGEREDAVELEREERGEAEQQRVRRRPLPGPPHPLPRCRLRRRGCPRPPLGGGTSCGVAGYSPCHECAMCVCDCEECV